MKLAHTVLATLALVVLMSVVAPPSRAGVSFEGFYSSLSPHGSWLVSAQFGRVWQPRDCGPGWNPYYDGHWEYADVGWTWVSDYSWGAIPYHYGTWTLDPRVGWVWVPGYTWAPAWVVFRTGPDYIGWAPVAPSFSIGVSFGGHAAVAGPFVYVPTHDFAAWRIRSHVVRGAHAARLARETRLVDNLVLQHNIVINRGPDVRVVEAASHRKIPVTALESLPRVAPFASVNRAQLAVSPTRARQMVRATEPKPAHSASQIRPSGTSGHHAGKPVKNPKEPKTSKQKEGHNSKDNERRTS
jgi:hypothetical protein